MKDGYQLYYKLAENVSYQEHVVLPTLEEAMANSYLVNSVEAYADPADWREAASPGTWVLVESATSERWLSSPWLIDRIRLPESDAERIQLAVELAFKYGGFDGAHHKMWVIDQMLRLLLGDSYDAAVAEAKSGEDGPETYDWDTGVAP